MNMAKNNARGTLFQIVFFLIAISAGLFFFRYKLETLYLSGDVTMASLILNGLIVVLFLLGVIQMVMTLLRYMKEHRSLQRLVGYLQEEAADPIARLSPKALCVQRYKYVHWISRQGSPVNQAALAATLNAGESSRLTLIRFVHSILILAGVFGTVVSLSLALVGASSLLGSPESTKEMGMVIGGMSSALSTTMTAIICFIVYAYFYLRLNDARVRLLSGIEDTTTLYMLPKLNHSEESLIRRVERLTLSLNKSAERIAAVENKFMLAADQLQHAATALNKGVSKTGMDEILTVLREGFRLPVVDSSTLEAMKKDQTNQSTTEIRKGVFRGFKS